MLDAIAPVTVASQAPSEVPAGEGTQPAAEGTGTTEGQTPDKKEARKNRITELAEFNKRAQQNRELQQLREKAKSFESDTEYQRFLALKRNPNRSPIDVLKEFDLDMDKVTSSLLEDKASQPSETETLRNKIEKLEKMLTEKNETDSKKELETNIRSYKENLRSHISGNERFELMGALGDRAIDKAYEEMLDFYKQTNEVPTNDELCEAVEDALSEEIEAEIDRLSKLKKFSKKFGKPSEPSEQAAPATEKPGETTPTTLSNSLVQRTSASQAHIKDDRRALEEAASMLRFK